MGRGRQAQLTRVIGGLALAVGLAIPVTLVAQSQPKFPVPLPVPKAATTQPVPAGSSAEIQAQGAGPGSPAPGTPAGPRDPFDPLVKRPAPGEERRLQEIAGLRLVGVVWDSADQQQIRALVETPDGLGYYLGLHEDRFGGTVVAIDRDRVQFSIREPVPGGASRVRIVELKLARPDGP